MAASVSNSLTTVAECFNQTLPPLLQGPLSYKSVKPSSQTTKDAVPPSVLLCKSHGKFRQIAEDFLGLEKTRTSNQTQQPLGTTFEQITLNNESDLVMASTLYVIKPLLNVLNLAYGKDAFTLTSEKITKSEQLESGERATRVDLVFRSAKGKREAILVIECKRREQIRYSDFQDALLRADATTDEINAKVTAAFDEEGSSFLHRNALSYTKQVAMYAKQNRCKHIALLNWDHLLLFEFDKVDDAAASGTTAGTTAELTWISEKQSQGTHVAQDSIRMALLGFTLQAFKEHFKSQADG